MGLTMKRRRPPFEPFEVKDVVYRLAKDPRYLQTHNNRRIQPAFFDGQYRLPRNAYLEGKVCLAQPRPFTQLFHAILESNWVLHRLNIPNFT